MEGRARILFIARSSQNALEIDQQLSDDYQLKIQYSWQSALDAIDDFEPDLVIADGCQELDLAMDFCIQLRNEWMEHSYLATLLLLGDETVYDLEKNPAIDVHLRQDNMSQDLLQSVRLALRFKTLQDQNKKMADKLSLTEDMVSELQTFDSITQLYNLPSLSEKLKDIVRRSIRFAEPLSILMISVDHFASFSNRQGPIFCIQLLQQLGHELLEGFRDSDFVGRSWGAKFIAILPDTMPEDARCIAERLRDRIAGRKNFGHDNHPVTITLSQGISYFHPIKSPHVTAEDLLVIAEEQLSRAIEIGEGKICCMPEMQILGRKSEVS